ncbi:MAG: putative sulfate exporter family transporter [Synergistaceae bacterium]|nr:putative sulfate exporter family transporter [Synergistaceae bacterium]
MFLSPKNRRKAKLNTKISGVLVCFIIAFLSTFVSKLQHFMSGPIVGLIICMIIMNTVHMGAEFLKGAKFASKTILNCAIVLVGGTLNIHQVMGTGGRALPMLICNIVIALLVSGYVGRRMKMTSNTCILIGSGTSICGGTAIATAASVINAAEEEIAYAMAAIFFFDIIGALVFPWLAVGMGLTNGQTGILIGGAVNDMSSVAAAEATFNALTGQNLNLALTVKLARTTLLIPLAIFLSIFTARRNVLECDSRGSVYSTLRRVFPWVIVGFVTMAVLNSLGLISGLSRALTGSEGEIEAVLRTCGKFLTTVALCGVGFKIKFRDLMTRGLKPVLLGCVTWISITAFAFLYIYL